MTIRLNGSSNPEAIEIRLNGQTYGVDKVQFQRNGVTTVVWEGFPASVTEIKLNLAGANAVTLKNCRYKSSTEYVINGVKKQVGVYTCSMSWSVATTSGQSLGRQSDVTPNLQYSVNSAGGVPPGYTFYSLRSNSSSKMVYVDDTGIPVFDPSKVKREQRDCVVISGNGSVQMYITAKKNDKVYYATGPLNFGGQATLYLMKN